MSKTKKILITIGLSVLICLTIYRIVFDIGTLKEYFSMLNEEFYLEFPNIQIKTQTIRLIIFVFFEFLYVIVFVICLYKINKSNFVFIKYSYEEFKKTKKIKKDAKQTKKIEKYQQKIDNLKK